MIKIIKGRAAEMRKEAIAALAMQDWLEGERAEHYPALVALDAHMVLAVDERHRLLGSFMWFPSIRDEWVRDKEADGCFPFDVSRAFTNTMVFVDRSCRGKGIGRTLFLEAQADALSRGFDVRLGYGPASGEIWDFSHHVSIKPVLIEGLECKGWPVCYTEIAPSS